MPKRKLRNNPIQPWAVRYYAMVHVLGLFGTWHAAVHATPAVIYFAVAYFFLVHLSITCGAHRLYAHESYQASQLLQWTWVLLFSGAAQGPIIWWAGKHRLHHAKEDTLEDPHSPRRGFWFSHMGWLVRKYGPKQAPPKYLAHLLGERSDRFYPAKWQSGKKRWVLMPLMALVVPTLFGWYVEDPVGGLLVGGFTRLMFQYHLTWAVNSIGHTFGETKGGTATNNWLLAIVTVGESFHANHHEEPLNPRLGRKWYDIDLGWYTIKACTYLGLARLPRNTSA